MQPYVILAVCLKPGNKEAYILAPYQSLLISFGTVSTTRIYMLTPYKNTSIQKRRARALELSCSKHLRLKSINRPHSASASPERRRHRKTSLYYFGNTPAPGDPSQPNQRASEGCTAKVRTQNTKLELDAVGPAMSL